MNAIEKNAVFGNATFETIPMYLGTANGIGVPVSVSAAGTPANAEKITDCNSYMKQLVAEGKEATLLEARGKQQLYKVLADCYKLYLQLEVDKDEQLQAAFKEYLKQRGFNFGNRTEALNKILYAVFCNASTYKDERQRISAYATALTTLFTKNVKTDDVVKEINASNGIEKLRKKESKSNVVKVSAQDKRDLASNMLDKQQLFTLDSTTCNNINVGKQVGNLIVLIGNRQQDGSIVIRAAECNNSLIDVVRENYYDQHIAGKDETAPQTQNIAMASATDTAALIASFTFQSL
jgi:hypothetical protein